MFKTVNILFKFKRKWTVCVISLSWLTYHVFQHGKIVGKYKLYFGPQSIWKTALNVRRSWPCLIFIQQSFYLNSPFSVFIQHEECFILIIQIPFFVYVQKNIICSSTIIISGFILNSKIKINFSEYFSISTNHYILLKMKYVS